MMFIDIAFSNNNFFFASYFFCIMSINEQVMSINVMISLHIAQGNASSWMVSYEQWTLDGIFIIKRNNISLYKDEWWMNGDEWGIDEKSLDVIFWKIWYQLKNMGIGKQKSMSHFFFLKQNDIIKHHPMNKSSPCAYAYWSFPIWISHDMEACKFKKTSTHKLCLWKHFFCFLKNMILRRFIWK